MAMPKDKEGNYLGSGDLVKNEIDGKIYKILFVGDSTVVLAEMDMSTYPPGKVRELSITKDDLGGSYLGFTQKLELSMNDLVNAATGVNHRYDMEDLSAREIGEKMWEILLERSKPKSK